MVRKNYRGSILVIEDDTSQRRSLEAILTHAGYAVHLAADGRAGLDALRELGDTLDVVFTDLNLPKVSGADVIAQLRASHPDLPVVLATGLGASWMRPEVRASATVFLHKPYDVEQLLDAVRQATHRASA